MECLPPPAQAPLLRYKMAPPLGACTKGCWPPSCSDSTEDLNLRTPPPGCFRTRDKGMDQGRSVTCDGCRQTPWCVREVWGGGLAQGKGEVHQGGWLAPKTCMGKKKWRKWRPGTLPHRVGAPGHTPPPHTQKSSDHSERSRATSPYLAKKNPVELATLLALWTPCRTSLDSGVARFDE